LGVVGETGVYFQISGKCSGGFSPICIYILTSGIGNGWSSGFETSLTSSISADLFTFCRVSIFGRDSTSGKVFTPRSYRARVLVTMVEAGPAPRWVTTGVGSVSRGAGTKPNSPDRSGRPTLRLESDSMSIIGIFTKHLLYRLRKNVSSLPK